MGITTSLLRSTAFLTPNRNLAHEIGLTAATLLAELCDRYEYYLENGKSESFNGKDDYFYETIEQLHARTSISRREQDTAIKKLKDLGVIETLLKGLPAKRYFRIDEDKLDELVKRSKRHSSLYTSAKLDCTETPNSVVRKRQTRPIYTKDLSKRNNKEIQQVQPAIFLDPSINFGKHVNLMQGDYDDLCAKYTKPVVDEHIESINDYISAHGKKPYKDYAATLRCWIKRSNSKPSQATYAKFPPKKEEWLKINQDFANKVVEEKGARWINVDTFYVNNRKLSPLMQSKTELDMRTIEPEAFPARLEALIRRGE